MADIPAPKMCPAGERPLKQLVKTESGEEQLSFQRDGIYPGSIIATQTLIARPPEDTTDPRSTDPKLVVHEFGMTDLVSGKSVSTTTNGEIRVAGKLLPPNPALAEKIQKATTGLVHCSHDANNVADQKALALWFRYAESVINEATRAGGR